MVVGVAEISHWAGQTLDSTEEQMEVGKWKKRAEEEKASILFEDNQTQNSFASFLWIRSTFMRS
jgi:hypothetical protein